DQDRPATSFSQGARWKALISRYIGVMPLSGDDPAAEHNASTGPLSTPVSSAMIAKVGEAARYSQSAAVLAIPLPLSRTVLQPRMVSTLLMFRLLQRRINLPCDIRPRRHRTQ